MQEERSRLRPVVCWICGEMLASREMPKTKLFQYRDVGEIERQPLCHPKCTETLRKMEEKYGEE